MDISVAVCFKFTTVGNTAQNYLSLAWQNYIPSGFDLKSPPACQFVQQLAEANIKKKHQCSTLLTLCAGNPPDSPHKGEYRHHGDKRFIIMNDDVIKWKHFRVCVCVWGGGGGGGGPSVIGGFLWYAPETNGWANNQDAGYLRRHRAQYDVTVMVLKALPDIEWSGMPQCLKPVFAHNVVMGRLSRISSGGLVESAT